MKVVDFILRFWRDRPVFGSCQLSDLDSDGSGSVPPLAYSRCQGTPRVDREIDQTKGSKFCFVGPSVSDLILLSWKGEGRYFPKYHHGGEIRHPFTRQGAAVAAAKAPISLSNESSES